MYVKETDSAGNVCLHEYTEKEFREAGPNFRRVSASEAHKWVRDGGVHTTPLWVDEDNRIRKARG